MSSVHEKSEAINTAKRMVGVPVPDVGNRERVGGLRSKMNEGATNPLFVLVRLKG